MNLVGVQDALGRQVRQQVLRECDPLLLLGFGCDESCVGSSLLLLQEAAYGVLDQLTTWLARHRALLVTELSPGASGAADKLTDKVRGFLILSLDCERHLYRCLDGIFHRGDVWDFALAVGPAALDQLPIEERPSRGSDL